MRRAVIITGNACLVCGSTDRYLYGCCVPCAKRRSNEWKSKNREKARASNRAYHAAKPRSILAAHRRRKYPKPSRPEPEACEMCEKPSLGKSLNLDHCHVSERFRGWLCWGCNVALGKLGDNIDLAINRLEKYRKLVKESTSGAN